MTPPGTRVTNRLLQTILRGGGDLLSDPTSDAELLRRCETAHDEAAFAALVRRHGPMVWAVCRRMLPNPADAEDAFQAVFVALLQTLRKLKRVTSVGGWLHGSAVRVCQRVRRGHARRRRREEAAARPEGVDAPPDWSDLHAAVHEEVERLPAPLRTAFVLCELQGVRQPDAASQLGCKLGTLSGRLTRARQALLKRLTARGVTPLVVVGAVGGAGLPAALAGQTATLMTSYPDFGSGVSSTILLLARAATEGLMTKTKWTVGSFVLTGGLMAALGTVWLPSADAQRPASEPKPRGANTTPTGTAPTSRATEAPPADPNSLTPSAPMAESPRRAATGAPRYEHQVLTSPPTREELVQLIRKQERAGWEFAGSVPLESSKPELVFKRPLRGASLNTLRSEAPTLPPTEFRPTDVPGETLSPLAFPEPAATNIPRVQETFTPPPTVPAGVPTSPATTPPPTQPGPGSYNPLSPATSAPTSSYQPMPVLGPSSGDTVPTFDVVSLRHTNARELESLLTRLYPRGVFAANGDNTLVIDMSDKKLAESVLRLVSDLEKQAESRGDKPAPSRSGGPTVTR